MLRVYYKREPKEDYIDGDDEDFKQLIKNESEKQAFIQRINDEV